MGFNYTLRFYSVLVALIASRASKTPLFFDCILRTDNYTNLEIEQFDCAIS